MSARAKGGQDERSRIAVTIPQCVHGRLPITIRRGISSAWFFLVPSYARSKRRAEAIPSRLPMDFVRSSPGGQWTRRAVPSTQLVIDPWRFEGAGCMIDASEVAGVRVKSPGWAAQAAVRVASRYPVDGGSMTSGWGTMSGISLMPSVFVSA